MKKTAMLAIAGLAGVALYRLGSASRAFVEKLAYTVRQKDGRFEIRDYPAMTLASTPMRDEARDTAFRRLFSFINGGNAQQEKIAMTAPIFIRSNGVQPALCFVMPSETHKRGVPNPTDEAVTLQERAPERVVVYRLRGRLGKEQEEQAVDALRGWMQSQGLEARGEPIVAYYGAPWMPALLRRNEIMLPVKSEIASPD